MNIYYLYGRKTIKISTMNATSYLLILITIVLFTMLYPLLRKIVSLLEIFVGKYSQQVNTTSSTPTSSNDTAKTILSLKLLAYERIILFIERMKPDSLVPRTLSTSLTCKEYQLLLIGEIRREFEYNISQQLYVSENTWTVTVNFKDNIITLINSASADCKPENPAGELARKILEQYIASDLKADRILKMIKSDFQ